MDSYFCNDKPHSISDWSQEDTSVFRKYKVPELSLRHVIAQPFGQLLFYEFLTKDYLIQYNLFHITDNVKVTIIGSRKLPNILLNLWSSMVYSMNDETPWFIRSHHYSLENKPYFKWEAHLKKDRQYSFLRIYFPPEQLEMLTEDTEKLKSFIDNVSLLKCAFYPLDFMWTTSNMTQEIMKIMHWEIKDPTDKKAIQKKELYLQQVTMALLIEGLDNLTRDGRRPSRRRFQGVR